MDKLLSDTLNYELPKSWHRPRGHRPISLVSLSRRKPCHHNTDSQQAVQSRQDCSAALRPTPEGLFCGTVRTLTLGRLEEPDDGRPGAETIASLADVLTVVVGLHRPDDELEPALVRVENIGVVEENVDRMLVVVSDLNAIVAKRDLRTTKLI